MSFPRRSSHRYCGDVWLDESQACANIARNEPPASEETTTMIRNLENVPQFDNPQKNIKASDEPELEPIKKVFRDLNIEDDQSREHFKRLSKLDFRSERLRYETYIRRNTVVAEKGDNA